MSVKSLSARPAPPAARPRPSSRLAARAGLLAAGIGFAAYPVLRPYGAETGVAGAQAYGSVAWLVAHVLGMAAFAALAFALRAAATAHPWAWGGRPIREAETRAWLAVVLLLPYYGAEAYGLHELGRYALAAHDTGPLAVAGAFRFAPFETVTFLAGLTVLIAVGARIARGLWGVGPAARVGGVLAGVGLATYLPQFFAPPAVRVAHGLVLGTGLVLMAITSRRPTVA